MRLALSLRSKVALVALLNAALIAAALAWFATTQLTQGFGTLLIGEARERLTHAALEVGHELRTTSLKDRDAMLDRYSKKYGVTFNLLHLNGMNLGGPELALPEIMREHLRATRSKTPLLDRPENIERLARQNRTVPRQDSFDLDKPQLDGLLNVILDAPFFTKAGGRYWVTFRAPIRASDDPLFQPGLIVFTSASFFGNPFFFDLRPWLGLLALLLAIALACWWPLVRGANRAIAGLLDATREIASGRFSAKVEVRRADELGRLGESFNRMAEQLDSLVRGRERFLRDTAHELRSPLARMQGALGNIDETTTFAEAAPFLADLREEVELMSSLTAELLAFARAANARRNVALAPVDLPAMAARVVSTENPAGTADVRLRLEPGLSVSAHAESLFRGLSNVVRNAIRYAGHAGPITLAAEARDGAAVVTVSDRGPGIPGEALELIFTPFYRLDVSRDRATGGHGLGMAIVRSCIEACEGTVYCRNAQPGLEVVITLRTA